MLTPEQKTHNRTPHPYYNHNEYDRTSDELNAKQQIKNVDNNTSSTYKEEEQPKRTEQAKTKKNSKGKKEQKE